MKWASDGLAIVWCKYSLQNIKDAITNLILSNQIAFKNFDANIYILFEYLRVNLFPFPQNYKVNLECLFYEVDTTLLIFQQKTRGIKWIIFNLSLTFFLIHGFCHKISLNFLFFDCRHWNEIKAEKDDHFKWLPEDWNVGIFTEHFELFEDHFSDVLNCRGKFFKNFSTFGFNIVAKTSKLKKNDLMRE